MVLRIYQKALISFSSIEKNGFRPELTSKMQTYEGISESLLKFLKNYNYEIS